MIQWIKGGLQETDGQASFARICCAVIVTFDMAWISYVIYFDHKIPDQAGVVTLVTLIYGINKVAAAITGKT